MAEQRMIEKKR